MKPTHLNVTIRSAGLLGMVAMLSLTPGCERKDREGRPGDPNSPVTPWVDPAKPAPDQNAPGSPGTVGNPDVTGRIPDRSGTTGAMRDTDAVGKTDVSGTTNPVMADEKGSPVASDDAKTKKLEAKAKFKTVPGVKLSGEADFKEMDNGVKVVVELDDSAPGKRGIHIHEKGDCSDIAGKSMGEHFAPNAQAHGLPPQAKRHLGDLGNIQVGKDGKARLEITIPNANLRKNDPMSFLGRALVIHETEDQGSQPSGASGKPVACAVIEPD